MRNTSKIWMFCRLSQGSLFLNMWTKQGTQEVKSKGSPLTVDEVMENVWQVTYPTWTTLSKRIAEGNITFKEFQEHFKNVATDNLKQQLSYLPGGKRDWVTERLHQVKEHRELQQCVTGASIILKVVKEYDLKGNFEPIRMILKVVIILVFFFYFFPFWLCWVKNWKNVLIFREKLIFPALWRFSSALQWEVLIFLVGAGYRLRF